MLQPATPALVDALFAGRATVAERLDVLVTGTCDCYRDDRPWLAALRGGEDTHDRLRALARSSVENLAVLVRAALGPRPADARRVQVITALLDFPFWNSLLAVGLDAPAATEQVRAMVHEEAAKAARR